MSDLMNDYKEHILKQIDERNASYNKFAEIILSCERLRQERNNLEKNCRQFESQIKRLSEENESHKNKAGTGNANIDRSEQVSVLEQKLMSAQEELVEIQRTKGSRIQQIADLNIALREQGQEIKTLTDKLEESEKKIGELMERSEKLEQQLECETRAKQTVQDEYQALLLASSVNEEKLRKKSDENRELIERFLRYKNSDANSLNSENDTFKRKKDEMTTAALEEAMSETTLHRPQVNRQQIGRKPQPTGGNSEETPSPPLNFLQRKFQDLFHRKADEEQSGAQQQQQRKFTAAVYDVIPKSASCKWRAHDSEVTACRSSSNGGGGLLATGGYDKIINVWNFVGEQPRLHSALRGSNGGITSIDMDPEEQLISASSNDCAARIWLIATQRLRLTLTGHGGKVLSTAFLGSTQRLATGSQDRTVKIWNIGSGACLQTLMAGSSCNDVISADGIDCVVSGHFDKKIRVWDARSGRSVNEICVGGRVTSLDMPSLDSMTSLVCCTKDHTIEVVDLRKSQVRCVFSEDCLKVASDQTRCAFSANGEYVAVGSTDGSVLAWNVNNQQLVANQQVHTDPVISCDWKSGRLVTGDKNKTCIVWG